MGLFWHACPILADYGKRLAGNCKNGRTALGSMAPMKMKEAEFSRQPDSEDFAVAGVFGSSVVLEANEWDLAMGVYRVVTLYLDPGSAQELAQQLAYCAAATTHDGATTQ